MQIPINRAFDKIQFGIFPLPEKLEMLMIWSDADEVKVVLFKDIFEIIVFFSRVFFQLENRLF